MIDINIPIIYINDYDYVRVNSIIYEAIGDWENVEEWNPGAYLTELGSLSPSEIAVEKKVNEILQDLYHELFTRFRKPRSPFRILILRDIQDFICEPSIKSLLASIAQRKLYDSFFGLTIIIVSPVNKVPEELMPYVSFLDFGFPDDEEIRNIIYRHLYINHKCLDDGVASFEELSNISESDINKIVQGFVEKECEREVREVEKLLPNFRGLKPFHIDRMVDMAMSRNGILGESDNQMILEHKRQIVKKSGVLELVDSDINIDQIGGLNRLKKYLRNKALIRKNRNEARNNGVSMPKGIFLVGMPGCGKSLTAKATATLFNELLLKLDMGTLMGGRVGDSEKNLRKAIEIAEATAPCVLWIDEIEKGFAGSKNDENAYLRRMFGYFLSWLQDNKSDVFVIATANNLDTLPPELKRKGRFDNMFFVDLPDKDECKAIFELKINNKYEDIYKYEIEQEEKKKLFEGEKRKIPVLKSFVIDMDEEEDIDLINYVSGEESENIHFCGADIEYVVNEAFERMYRIPKDIEEHIKRRKEIEDKIKQSASDNKVNKIVLKKLKENLAGEEKELKDLRLKQESLPKEVNSRLLLEIAQDTKCISQSSYVSNNSDNNKSDFDKMKSLSPKICKISPFENAN